MVADAPRFEELGAAILRRLDGCLFVAHNAGFDYGFLRSEFRRIGMRFSAPRLCTVRLSRRLFPEEHGHSLDALIDRHALRCDARHRALGDARVLPALLDALEMRAGRARLDEAVAAQIRATQLPPGLPADLGDDLPELPGVYVFRGEGGVPLYVGMGRNLRSRVLAHFSGRDRDAAIVRDRARRRMVRDGRGVRCAAARVAADQGPCAARASSAARVRRRMGDPAAW